MAPVGATPPSDVVFAEKTDLLGGPGPFTASGPAEDYGIICATGIQQDVGPPKFAPGFPFSGKPRGVNVQVFKLFTCDDGSGTFLVKQQVREDRRGNNFNWKIVSGTGDYVDLQGAGSGFGLRNCGDDCLFNVYEGGLH